MDTKKKMSIGLAMAAIMVAAVLAPMALAQGPWVHYEVEVRGIQQTYICCGPDGYFGPIARGESSLIKGTFGLRNEGDANATVEARFTTQLASGNFGLVNKGDTAVIDAEHFALKQGENASKLFPCCSTVEGGDPDVNTPLISFNADETHAENEVVNTAYDCGEWIYKDKEGGNPAAVEIGDTRLTDVHTTSKFYPCGSVVVAGDEDIAEAGTLIAFGVNEKHFDADWEETTTNAYDCHEWIYNSVDEIVNAGDHRLTDVHVQCICKETPGCEGGEWVHLNNDGTDVQLDGIVPANGLCCCYGAHLHVPWETTPDMYSGNVQLTFSSAP